jgi:hypothetical protein
MYFSTVYSIAAVHAKHRTRLVDSSGWVDYYKTRRRLYKYRSLKEGTVVELTLNLKGSVEEIQAVLELLVQRGLLSMDSGDQPVDPRIALIQEQARLLRASNSRIVGTTQANLDPFVRLLTDKGVELVRTLAERSGEEFTAVELTAFLAVKEDQFYGVVGSAARVWTKVCSGPSPFTSHGSRQKNAPVWSLGADLAVKLIDALRKLEEGSSHSSA